MNRIAYLTCELKSRDLEPRLLIASHLLRAGIPVVVGQVWALVGNARAHHNLPGCYLFTTANTIQANAMKKVYRAGHSVLASNEETFALAGERILDSIAPEAMEFKFLAQTDSQQKVILSKFPGADITVTGSSRAELLLRMPTPQPANPPYILFNTSLALINSVWGSTRKALEVLGRGMRLTADEAKERIHAQRADAEIIADVIRWAVDHYRVVIRPHPAEKADAWRNNFPTAEVIEGSPPLPWIREASVLVHANSTTGLEAALMGVPAININPTEKWGERFVIKDVNLNATSAAQAIAAIKNCIHGNMPLPVCDMFPIDGAKNIANAVVDEVRSNQPLTGAFPWAPMQREASQIAKFSATREDVANSSALTGASIGAIHELEDSVFLLVPDSET